MLAKLNDDIKHILLQVGACLVVEMVGNIVVGFGDGTADARLGIGVATCHDRLADSILEAVAIEKTTQRPRHCLLARRVEMPLGTDLVDVAERRKLIAEAAPDGASSSSLMMRPVRSQ